ncbi:COPB2 protein, partial [Polypterus senegalus]
MSAPVASTGTASPVPLPPIPAPKQATQLPSDLNGNTPSQPILGSYPKHVFDGTSLRSFNPAWYCTRPWLEYSVVGDACFCFSCRKYGSTVNERDVVFTLTGLNNWKAALDRDKGLQRHVSSHNHVHASTIWTEHKSREATRGTVDSMLVGKTQLDKNHYYVKSIGSAIWFLCVNELGLCGTAETLRHDAAGNDDDIASDDMLIKLWDWEKKWCCSQAFEGHTHYVMQIVINPKDNNQFASASLDRTIKVWQLGSSSPNFTLAGHEKGVNFIDYYSGVDKPYLISGADDRLVKIWDYQIGHEEPAMSMDASGRIIWAKHSKIQQANLKAMGDAEIKDGEQLPLAVKDMGICEIYPQKIQHNSNGRFVVVCGDGEYIIYTAMVLRNKSFGSAQEFVWAHESSEFAVRESNSVVRIFKNFKEKKSFKPDIDAKGIHGGFLLGVQSVNCLAFYGWDNTELIQQIEIQPKHIFWSDSGEFVCIATEESFFILKYLADKVASAQESNEGVTEDGIEDAFEVQGEIQEIVMTGLWVGDCFIYTSSVKRLNYYVGGEIVTIAHLDRTMYLLGYIPKDNRLYLGDKELNIVSYSLLVSVLEYQTAVMRRNFSMAEKVLPTIPKEQRTRVAYFLEKQGFKQQAMAVSSDPEHQFDLALQLGELKIAHQLAVEAKSEQKWKRVAELAVNKCQFGLAQECLHHAQDYGGILLLATASGNTVMVNRLAEEAEKDDKNNVAFLSYFLQGKLDKCLELLLKTGRLPEAAFLARSYLPSQVSRYSNLLFLGTKQKQTMADSGVNRVAIVVEELQALDEQIQKLLSRRRYLRDLKARLLDKPSSPSVIGVTSTPRCADLTPASRRSDTADDLGGFQLCRRGFKARAPPSAQAKSLSQNRSPSLRPQFAFSPW